MVNECTDRGILFQADLVLANVEGRKWETRRLRGLKEINKRPDDYTNPTMCANGIDWLLNSGAGNHKIRCPYGKIGHTLWQRETHRLALVTGDRTFDAIWYIADGRKREMNIADAKMLTTRERKPWRYEQVRPGIHLPRWAARLVFRITNIRLQRLGEITDAEAIAEGMHDRRSFLEKWDLINGYGSVELNPWIWAVTYETVEHLTGVIEGVV